VLNDRESRLAQRFTSQNVRGLTHLELEKVIQFMKSRGVEILPATAFAIAEGGVALFMIIFGRGGRFL
jgi:hypothetical protein